MNYLRDTSESGVSCGSSSPRSSTPIPEEMIHNISFEEFYSMDGLFLEPHLPVRFKTIREKGKPKIVICRLHEEEVRFFCNNCNIKGCIKCILLYHDSCETELLRSFTLKLCKAAIEDDIQEIRATKAKLQNTRQFFHANLTDVKRNIDLVTDNIIKEVKRKKNDLKKQLRFIEKERHRSWNYQIDLCQRSLMRLKSYSSAARKLNFKNINLLRKNIFGDLRFGLDFVESGQIDIDFVDFSYHQIGRIQVPPCPRKSYVTIPKSSYSNKYNTCTITIRNIFEEAADGNYVITASLEDSDFNSVYLTIQNEKNGKFTVSYYPTKPGKYLMYIYLYSVPIGRSPYKVNVVVDEDVSSVRCCSVFGNSGEGKLSRPWGICSDFRGRILVADRGSNSVKIFTENGKFVRSFGRGGIGPGEFNKPTGIAIDHVLERIIVTDKDNHRIQVFNFRGIYLLGFGSLGEMNGQFTYPWDVSVSESSLIAVSDSKNRRIQLFDQRGGFIRKFLFNINNISEIELPRGLTFRSDGFLMVTDFNKHRVVVLDDSFESVKKFGSFGTCLGEFWRPQSIDVDHFGKFAVADCRNNRIQIFKPNGELFCAFGSEGKKPGQLNSPQGICFLPSGRIAIVELNNNRVQVFEIPKN